MRKIPALIAALALSWILPAHAVDTPQKTIQVEINKGQMVRLSRTAKSVMVADPAIADIQVVSPRAVYVHAKKIGETSLYAVDSSDNTVLDATIEVTHNISKLNRTIKALMPDADIDLKTVDGGLVVNGFVDSPMESEQIKSLANTFLGANDKLVNMVTTAGSDQVMLMVKIVEVSRNDLKRFGINLAGLFNTGNFAFSVLQGRTILDAAGNVLRTGSDNSLFGGFRTSRTNVNGIIDALEDEGLVSVLAEPNLTTTSGKPADFLAGGEFPIPLVDSDGNVTVEYKPYGISLNFTPVVLSKDKISLSVTPEVSNINQIDSLQIGENTTFAIPSIQTRRAQTTVELGSGQSFAIAGLLSNDRSNGIDKFPGLGDLPVLGALFRSHEFRNNQSELVIVVTPFIVRPVSEPKKMSTPIDGYTPPNDLERLLLGKINSEQEPMKDGDDSPPAPATALPPADAPRLHGDGGFILE